MIKVESLPQIPDLEEITLCAGQRGKKNMIRWPYIAEHTDIEDWIEGGELIFVTGLSCKWEIEDFHYLISIGKNRNASGLVILIGHPCLPAIPQAVLDFADKYDFPVFKQPYSLPMVKVTEKISNAIMQANLEQQSTRWLMQHLVETSHPSDLTLSKAAELGIEINKPLSVAVINHCHIKKKDLKRCELLLNQFVSEYESPLPVLEYRQGWLAAIQVNDKQNDKPLKFWQQLAEVMQSQSINCNIGVSDASDLRHLSETALQANQTAKFGVTHGSNQVTHYNNLGISQLFSKIDDPKLLSGFCRQHLGQLYADNDKSARLLKETLSCYFENLCSLRMTAKALGIHRNTLSNRLAKIEKLTNLRLDNAQQRLSIQVALVAEQSVLPLNIETPIFQHNNKADQE